MAQLLITNEASGKDGLVDELKRHLCYPQVGLLSEARWGRKQKGEERSIVLSLWKQLCQGSC